MMLEIDLRNVHTAAGAHAYLQYLLDLPEWYGRNLDALYDVLTEIGEETALTVRMAPSGPEWQNAMRQVFEDACDENPHLSVKILS